MTDYDVIIIGAGSVGVPTAMAIAESGQSVLVIDKNASPGQGENKHAIGGVRATHTSKAKIILSLKSIEIFSTWKEKHGEDIEWIEGGYSFVAYDEDIEKTLKEMLPIQKKYGLLIDFYGPDKIKELIPGINPNNLRGGTYSPLDGSASPLVSINAFFRYAVSKGAKFNFNEEVTNLVVNDGKISKVETNKGSYSAKWIINASGPGANNIAGYLGIELPLYTDSHEAGVSEPMQRFLEPMIVDLRKEPGSKNYYFYQDKHGSLVFCITPEPSIIGTNIEETSIFLPQIAKRMVDLVPRLRNLKIRRTWRGLYPMSPDGIPIIGKVKNIENYINANGMSGQGFMLGPGVGYLLSRLTNDKLIDTDIEILEELSLYRDFGTVEKLK